MSLLLGIYSFTKSFENSYIQAVIDNFSINRNIKIIKKSGLILTAFPKFDLNTFFENEGILIGVGGVIYNTKQHLIKTRKNNINPTSDNNIAENIYYLYTSLGIDFIKELNGVFTIVIYDTNIDKLYVVNDQFGTYPLFYYIDKDYFIFSNEYEPLLKYPRFNLKIDYISVAEYLILGAPLGGKTFFNTINNLKPASLLVFQNNSFEQKKHYINNVSINYHNTIEDFANDFAEVFRKSVKLRTEEQKEIICSLTGGFDTRLILSAMSNDVKRRAKFITLLTEPLSQEEDRDVMIAKMLTSYLNLNHVIEPMGEWTNVWTKHFEVSYFEDVRYRDKEYIMSGFYGSELVKGDFINIIPSVLSKKIKLSNRKIFNSLKRILPITKEFHSKKTENFLSDKLLSCLPVVYKNLNEEVDAMASENKIFEFSMYYMSRSFFSKMYGGSFGSWLTTYKFPLEYSLPFFDKDILALMLSMPVEFIVSKNMKFYSLLFNKHFTEFNKIPSSSIFPKQEGFEFPAFYEGKEPKNMKHPQYEKAFKKCISETLSEDLNIFNLEKLRKFNGNCNDENLRCFIEFETWLRYISNL